MDAAAECSQRVVATFLVHGADGVTIRSKINISEGKPIIAIGRDPGCEVRCLVPNFALRHVEVTYEKKSKQIFVTCLDDVRGATLNNSPLITGKATLFTLQDVLSVNTRKFTICAPIPQNRRPSTPQKGTPVRLRRTPNGTIVRNQYHAANDPPERGLATPVRTVKVDPATPSYMRPTAASVAKTAILAAASGAAGSPLPGTPLKKGSLRRTSFQNPRREKALEEDPRRDIELASSPVTPENPVEDAPGIEASDAAIHTQNVLTLTYGDIASAPSSPIAIAAEPAVTSPPREGPHSTAQEGPAETVHDSGSLGPMTLVSVAVPESMVKKPHPGFAEEVNPSKNLKAAQASLTDHRYLPTLGREAAFQIVPVISKEVSSDNSDMMQSLVPAGRPKADTTLEDDVLFKSQREMLWNIARGNGDHSIPLPSDAGGYEMDLSSADPPKATLALCAPEAGRNKPVLAVAFGPAEISTVEPPPKPLAALMPAYNPAPQKSLTTPTFSGLAGLTKKVPPIMNSTVLPPHEVAEPLKTSVYAKQDGTDEMEGKGISAMVRSQLEPVQSPRKSVPQDDDMVAASDAATQEPDCGASVEPLDVLPRTALSSQGDESQSDWSTESEETRASVASASTVPVHSPPSTRTRRKPAVASGAETDPIIAKRSTRGRPPKVASQANAETGNTLLSESTDRNEIPNEEGEAEQKPRVSSKSRTRSEKSVPASTKRFTRARAAQDPEKHDAHQTNVDDHEVFEVPDNASGVLHGTSIDMETAPRPLSEPEDEPAEEPAPVPSKRVTRSRAGTRGDKNEHQEDISTSVTEVKNGLAGENPDGCMPGSETGKDAPEVQFPTLAKRVTRGRAAQVTKNASAIEDAHEMQEPAEASTAEQDSQHAENADIAGTETKAEDEKQKSRVPASGKRVTRRRATRGTKDEDAADQVPEPAGTSAAVDSQDTEETRNRSVGGDAEDHSQEARAPTPAKRLTRGRTACDAKNENAIDQALATSRPAEAPLSAEDQTQDAGESEQGDPHSKEEEGGKESHEATPAKRITRARAQRGAKDETAIGVEEVTAKCTRKLDITASRSQKQASHLEANGANAHARVPTKRVTRTRAARTASRESSTEAGAGDEVDNYPHSCISEHEGGTAEEIAKEHHEGLDPNVEAPLPKRAGRPRKVQAATEGDAHDSLPAVQVQTRPTRSRNASAPGDDIHTGTKTGTMPSQDPVIDAPPRRPGRPRKVRPVTEDEDVSAEQHASAQAVKTRSTRSRQPSQNASHVVDVERDEEEGPTEPKSVEAPIRVTRARSSKSETVEPAANLDENAPDTAAAHVPKRQARSRGTAAGQTESKDETVKVTAKDTRGKRGKENALPAAVSPPRRVTRSHAAH
ncbi:hypothetical protein HKX48_000526 [Thoreauomyces humboldtii]|nr:hypothetical protein HKX48_000526 [Thoreauomyces humboldtii]